ncbi:hypothetical protein DSC45_06510 [Streptomyces sp. YIM 130001]|uniref:DUF4429 domain-containing protein n=1 Tax=Streptomyces sp. YIM 130001 TaxID=2259644 RepID=UPI000E65DD0A|nr:DUF4429 domain-containing protein [Streptomyces sp. YIM 130001]RII19648.1 hypothetical protein DSC45_06510 [Streptomyces sp. YIM 130001]
MAEIIQRDGTWTFDGETLRIVPGRDKGVGLLRKTLGELAVPVRALAAISFEQGKKSGRLRLRLRDGADPLLQVTHGKLDDASDPYRLTVDSDRYGVAEYFVDEVRNALLLEQIPSEPSDSYLLPGPAVPVSATAGDGTVSFDGEQVRLEWKWNAEEAKSAAGIRTLTLEDLAAVEWHPAVGWENGYLRFTVRHAPTKAPPKYDPNSVELFGFKKDPLMALVAAAVRARMPHPSSPQEPAPALTKSPPSAPSGTPEDTPGSGTPTGDDHDALLRRLRELGELHQSGILTDDEFSLAKQAILKRL